MATGLDDFDEFVAAATVPLLRSARLLAGDWHLGEDLLQTTLAKVHAVWHRSNTWDAPMAYARKTMVNTYCGWRGRKWRGEIPQAEFAERASPGFAARRSPDDVAEGIATTDAINAALRRLAPRARAVVVLRYFEDLSATDTAAVLGCRASTVRAVASRALDQLRRDAALREGQVQ